MPQANQYQSIVSDANSPTSGIQQIIDPQGASRWNLRPADYSIAGSATVLGHYRTVGYCATLTTLSAGNIIQSLRWSPVGTQLMLLTRLSVQCAITGAITTAAGIDLQSFVFRGSTSNASGTGSTTLTLTGNNQKTKASMAATQFASGGEIRHAQGTSQPLTAAGGKTNDSQAFGYAYFGTLQNVTATGTAVLVSVGANVTPGGWVDLYNLSSLYHHPICLAANEGIETQVPLAGPQSGTIKIAFLYEWAELNTF